MKSLCLLGVSAAAISASLASGAAFATPPHGPRAVSVPAIADYNAAQVKAAGDIVSLPPGQNFATYSVNSGTLEINSRFTVTLPAGFSFSSQPALGASNAATFTLASGGIGQQSATFTVETAALTPGQTVSLGSFAVQGVTALETPVPLAAALPITMQSTNNSQITNNDPQPLSAPAFASDPGITAVYDGTFALIDLTSPTLGTLFAGSPTDTATIPIMELQTAAASEVLSPDGSPNALASSDTATLTIPGLFNGITEAFVASTAACTTPIATGSATPSQISIPGVPVGGAVYACITAGGTTLLSPTANGFTATVAPGTSTDFLATNATLPVNGFPGIISYMGGGVLSVTNFFTGDDAGYSSLLRVNNAGTSASNIFALVQPDTGGPALSGSLGSLAAGTGTVFTEAQIAAAVSGLSLANSGQRATLQLIVSGDFLNVKASSLLVNPGGVVDNVGVPANAGRRPPP